MQKTFSIESISYEEIQKTIIAWKLLQQIIMYE